MVASSILFSHLPFYSSAQPLLAANELRVQGESAATAIGDFQLACLNRMHYVGNMFYAGVNLQIVTEKFDDCCHFMKEHEHFGLMMTSVVQKVILILINGETEGNDEFIKFAEEEKIPRQIFIL
jgi:hypothetical protein